MKKHIEAKDAIKALNVFLKKQIDLVKQESELRLQVMKELIRKNNLMNQNILLGRAI